ncbi:MAG: hypothetical protein K2X47_06220, partial [Bdellovibrionales bacterium]|nr:hypothetical protein [Bdellovibrionales bacterium]
LAGYLQEVKLSKRQDLLIRAQNFKNWLVAKRTKGTYEPINIRMTEAELRTMSLMQKSPSTLDLKTGSAAVCGEIATGT